MKMMILEHILERMLVGNPSWLGFRVEIINELYEGQYLIKVYLLILDEALREILMMQNVIEVPKNV